MTTDIAIRQVSDVNGARIEDYDDYDDNSSSRLFERSRIKALAGLFDRIIRNGLIIFWQIIFKPFLECIY